MFQRSAQNQAIWRVALKLAFRQVQRASIWMNLLICTVMVLTFLNLVVITGILIGLIEGSFTANKIEYTGNILISELTGKTGIENAYKIRETLKDSPEVKTFTERYIQNSRVEANYQTRWDFSEPKNTISAALTGINPVQENNVTGLSNKLISGEYLNQNESGYILIGAINLAQYSRFSDAFDPLEDVEVGTRVKISLNSGEKFNLGISAEQINANSSAGNKEAEFIVKGIIDSKVDTTTSRVFMTQNDWKRLVNPGTDKPSEFAILLKENISEEKFKNDLINLGFDKYAKIETSTEAVPSFLTDIKVAFSLLGNVIGFIAIIVSAITVFVVIYINALTRRKQIGILKGIGISGAAIERAYILQSLFYAIVGSVIGYTIVFTLLIPYFAANPLNFPFSDGILAATPIGTITRGCILILVTAIAGYIPSWLIVRQNTLDSILGR